MINLWIHGHESRLSSDLAEPMQYGRERGKISQASSNYFPINGKVAEVVTIEVSILQTFTWGGHHITSFLLLVSTSIIMWSPKNLRRDSVEYGRHKFGLTWKFYVHSGTSKWIFHSHGSYVHLRQPTSKGSCMRKPFNRIP